MGKEERVNKIKSVIDRFEDGYTVLLSVDNKIHLDIPKEMLPEDAKEGDWLNINFELDRDETERRKERVEGLLGKLQGEVNGRQY